MQKIRLVDLMSKGKYRQFRLKASGPVYVLGCEYDAGNIFIGYICWRLETAKGCYGRSRVFDLNKKVFEVPMAW